MKNPYTVFETYPDGSVFPVNIELATEQDALRLRHWMRVGQGQFQCWGWSQLSALKGKTLSLSCFTPARQAEIRLAIENS